MHHSESESLGRGQNRIFLLWWAIPYCETTIVQVTPKSEKGKKATVPPTEDQLNRLTDFIAFLEN